MIMGYLILTKKTGKLAQLRRIFREFRLENGEFTKGPSAGTTSGYVKIAIENGPFIVSFSIKNGDFL